MEMKRKEGITGKEGVKIMDAYINKHPELLSAHWDSLTVSQQQALITEYNNSKKGD
jgi:hypothetical protein